MKYYLSLILPLLLLISSCNTYRPSETSSESAMASTRITKQFKVSSDTMIDTPFLDMNVDISVFLREWGAPLTLEHQHQYEVVGETYSYFAIKKGWFEDSLKLSVEGTGHRYYNPYLGSIMQKSRNSRDHSFRFFHYTNGTLTQGNYSDTTSNGYSFHGYFINGVLHGPFVGYDETNKLFAKGQIENGEKVGFWIYYTSDSTKPIYKGLFEKGKAGRIIKP